MKQFGLKIALFCLIFTALTEGRSQAKEPCPHPPSKIVIAGLGALMAVPDYFLWVTLHEGSHAVAAAAMGAKDVKINILPTHDSYGHLILGETNWNAHFSRNQQILALVAPKITDLTALGAYTVLLETGNLPKNKYAQLGLTMFATGALVDFSKHLFQTDPGNDMVRTYELLGAHTSGEKLPFRLLHGALVVGGAIEVGRGWYRLFKSDAPDGKASAEKMQLTPYGSPVIMSNGLGWAGTF